MFGPITLGVKLPNQPSWKKKLPTQITFSRILVGPVIVVGLHFDGAMAHYFAAFLFIAASITDYLDGYYARKFQVESTLGKLLDPIADKILVLCALVMLLFEQKIGPIVVALFLSRDILVGGIRSVAAAENIIISAKPVGKWKTGMQMVAIPCLLWPGDLLALPVNVIGRIGLWVSVVLSLYSGFDYVTGYFKQSKA